jgi:CCR4-NOT complex subunit CAF16
VQLLLDLERSVSVILLDEVTAELDVLARVDLLGFLRRESEARGVTIVYASHVLEGLALWSTHLAFLRPGPGLRPGLGPGPRHLRCFAPTADVPELAAGASLHELCERWMREDRDRARRPAV